MTISQQPVKDADDATRRNLTARHGDDEWWRRNGCAHVRISVTPLRNILAQVRRGIVAMIRGRNQWEERLTWMKAFGGRKRRKHGE